MIDAKSEYKVLAAILDDAEIINKCDKKLFTEHRKPIFIAMQQMYSEKGYVTPEGIENIYRTNLPSELFVPVTTIVEPIIETLERLFKKRQYKEAAQRIMVLAEEYNPSEEDLQNILLDAQVTTEYETDLFNASAELLATLEQKRTGTYKFVSTGFDFLDRMMGGEWPRKAISAIIADPGGAKTAFVCSSSLKMTQLQEPIPILFFSLEMSKTALLTRWAASICNIDTVDIKEGRISNKDHERLVEAINYINTLPIYVIETTNLSFDQMTPIIRFYVLNKGVQVVFVDYLQIMNIESDDRNKELGKIGKRSKQLAKKLGIHISFISQRTDGKNGVWQIRDSGDFPAATDIMIEIQTDEPDKDVRAVVFKFLKNREGPLGKALCTFDAKSQRFY